MKIISTTLIFASVLDLARGQNERTVGGFLFKMSDCPNKCLAYDELDQRIELESCRTSGNHKIWELDYSCGDKEGFFQIRHVLHSQCIADPEDCSACAKDINLVDCDNDQAAWFSYGSLRKTSPKAYNLYSARCWLNEGLVSVLATPSLESKTCPEDQSLGACQRIEWNVDHFSKDILYYEWSFNEVKTECGSELFTQIGAAMVNDAPQEDEEETVNNNETNNDDDRETVAAEFSDTQPQDNNNDNRKLTWGVSSAAAAMVVAGLVKKKRRVATRTNTESESDNRSEEGVQEQAGDAEMKL
jgi:hypothetical protein